MHIDTCIHTRTLKIKYIFKKEIGWLIEEDIGCDSLVSMCNLGARMNMRKQVHTCCTHLYTRVPYLPHIHAHTALKCMDGHVCLSACGTAVSNLAEGILNF